ncbi:MAG TPA: alanine--glyoxylate aminotransferase family protein [Sandaracinaceae bacterium LLY-WYZ-13_1]|nr:alanine--glyoxylate aminotransferase family protein [Sandaracinaceae bacterium LLY-WYZ-13_1]
MPLLMIPGPIEVSERVREAAGGPPPGHLAEGFVESFGKALDEMREVWMAGEDAQPFVIAGSGTIAMEMAVTNLLEPGQRAVVASSGYFSERIAEMVRRRGVEVTVVGAEPGGAPAIDAVGEALEATGAKALLATHVDTSTGVRVDAKALAELAREHGVLSIFDGVCATAAERFEMEAWGADVYLTASQKAIGLPAGLAMLVASRRAMDARAALKTPPPMSIDFEQWLPIMKAYERRDKAYFSTPATTLVRALPVALEEILERGMEARFALHERGGRAFRAAWASMGLELLPERPELAANTLSALWLPEGVGPELVPAVKARDVVIAGGLHPDLKTKYFRVGHMGVVLTRPDDLHRTVRAVGEALNEKGHEVDVDAAVAAFDSAFG